MKDLRDAGDFSQNITDYVVLMAMTPDSALSWAGARELWLGQAIEHWPDKRGFDEMFSPFYWEDVELSLRAWRRGDRERAAPRGLDRGHARLARRPRPGDALRDRV